MVRKGEGEEGRGRTRETRRTGRGMRDEKQLKGGFAVVTIYVYVCVFIQYV